MKKSTLALLLGIPLALNAANYYLVEGTAVDMSNFENYKVGNTSGNTATALPSGADILYIQNTDAVLNGSSATIEAGRFIFNNSTINLTGTNNSFVETNLSGTGNSFIGNAKNSTTTVNVLGSGNTFTINSAGMSFMLGSDSSTEGTNQIYVSSSSADARNTFNFNKDGGNLFINNSNDSASTSKTLIKIGDYTDVYTRGFQLGGKKGGEVIAEFAGKNSTLNVSGGDMMIYGGSGNAKSAFIFSGDGNSFTYGLSYKIGQDVMSDNAYAALEVRGKNNNLQLNNVFVGNANSTGGVAKLVFEGSTNTINIRGNTAFYLNGDVDGYGKKIGGGIDFIADNDGFAKVTMKMGTVFEGLITIDFSNYIVRDSENGDVLALATVNGTRDNLFHISGDLDAYFNVLGSDKYEILFGEDGVATNVLGVRVWETDYVIPEPSTYAAIFGALALAFVAYRKKRA